MVTYNKIAVGTDGSASSLTAVRAAASLAHLYEAELVIMSAWHAASGSLLNAPQKDPASVTVSEEVNAEQYLREAQAVAQEEGVTAIELRKISGPPAEAMAREVQETGIDLLVVGNKGVNTLSGRVFGNIPTEVVRNSTVNVFIVNTSERGS